MRVFSAYGEGLKKQLFWDLYNKARESDIVNLFGTGKETRDFIYIKDLLYAVELIIEKAKFEGGTINIANGIESSIQKVTTTFFDLVKPKVQINFTGENKKGDPINWKADISTLKSLGYIQKFTLKEGLTNYSKWLKELQ